MDKLTVENFRCFGAEQPARLAPLTLLVGENSTGKTSFMALTSILWDAVYRGNYLPEFKRFPFDLGTFQDIVHEGGGESQIEFSGGFEIENWKCRATFRKRASGPEIVALRIMNCSGSVVWNRSSSNHIKVRSTIGSNAWWASYGGRTDHGSKIQQQLYPDRRWGLLSIHDALESLRPETGTSEITEKERETIRALALFPYDKAGDIEKVFPFPVAMAPIRSWPERNYEQGYSSIDPAKERIPQYLATMRFDLDREKQWKKMKQALDAHGRQTGLFEQINIRPLGKENSDPFQLQFKIHDGNGGSSARNIIDVGYGVSQSLPVIVNLIEDNHPLLLLQQPEVHLHPRAQAGLGSILCAAATQNRRILVETHSDYLIDRVRMDVRDKKTDLTHEDVSILFFERIGPGVKIHDISIDEEGNICGAPPSYRQFFMDEVNRDLGF